MPKKRVRSNKQKDVVPANPEQTPEVKPDVAGESAGEEKLETPHALSDGRPVVSELGPDHTAEAAERYDWGNKDKNGLYK